MTTNLQPCPFNHNHELERYISGAGLMVSCRMCGIEMAVSKWNTRAAPERAVLIDTNDPESVEKTVKFLNHHIDEIISNISDNKNDVLIIALKKILLELLPLKNKRELFADSNEGFCAFVRVEYCVSFISEVLKSK